MALGPEKEDISGSRAWRVVLTAKGSLLGEQTVIRTVGIEIKQRDSPRLNIPGYLLLQRASEA